MKKKIVFIGSRINVIQKILGKPDRYAVSFIFVLEDSPLHEHLKKTKLNFILYTHHGSDESKILNLINKSNFDILVSNGCPFILPISQLKQIHPDALFINTHPTYLPHLRGKTPLNGVFYLNYNFIGATTHFMDDGIDTGNIIYQSKVNLTPDIDQGLVYYISFHLEGFVFERAMRLLESHQFNFAGIPQTEGTYFNREDIVSTIDFNTDFNESIIKKVKSLGMYSQGITLKFSGKKYTVFEASEITNPYLLKIFKDKLPGEILHQYNNKVIVKTLESAIKFSFFK